MPRIPGMSPVEMARHVLKDAPRYVVVEKVDQERLETLVQFAKEVRGALGDLWISGPPAADAIRALKTERDAAREALRQIVALCGDRQRFVMMGPRGFAQAEQIALRALESEEPATNA